MFPKTRADHWRLVAWLGQHGPVERVGSEGSANLGAGVARLLADTGLDVREVPCALTVRERRRLRCPGKSDPTDGLAIARITAREHDLAATGRPTRSQDPGRSPPHARLRELDRELRALADQLSQLVAVSRTRLVDLVGIGPILAARILGEGRPRRAAAERGVRRLDDGRDRQQRHDRRDHRPFPVHGRRRRLGAGRARRGQHGPQRPVHPPGVRGGLPDRVPAERRPVGVDTMPTWIHGIAENQPVTPVIETLRGLPLGTPVGSSLWKAVAWCLGILVASVAISGVLFQRRTA